MTTTDTRTNGAAAIALRREHRRVLVTPDAVTDEEGKDHAEKDDRAFGALFTRDPNRVSLALSCQVYDGEALVRRDVVLYVSVGTGTDPTRKDHDFIINAGQSILLSAADHPEIRGEVRYRYVDNSDDAVLPAYVNGATHTLIAPC